MLDDVGNCGEVIGSSIVSLEGSISIAKDSIRHPFAAKS